MKKYSRKREAILHTICSTNTHPTAEWVYMRLKPEYPELSLATVYRNIGEFIAEGEVISVGVVNGQERFDGFTEPHPHFVCDRCGCVIDVELEDDPALDAQVSRAHNVAVRCHEMTFRGVCEDCMMSAE